MILALLVVLAAVTVAAYVGLRRSNKKLTARAVEPVQIDGAGHVATHSDEIFIPTPPDAKPRPLALDLETTSLPTPPLLLYRELEGESPVTATMPVAPRAYPAVPSVQPAQALEPGPEVESRLFSGLPPDPVEPLDDIGRLQLSIGRLREASPEMSASRTLTAIQIRGLLIAVVAAALGFLVFGHNLLIVMITPIIVAYLAALACRIVLFRRSLAAPRTIAISDEEALAVPDWRLPIYTVLVPAYREPEVMDRLVEQLRQIRYPRERLDIKLLLEVDDTETVAAARDAIGAEHGGIEVVLVPAAQPRTKPKALNYGLTLARGQLLTIYDAEDRPDPLQLRRAAVALGRAPDDVVCLQAKLVYFNPQQNLITRWFAIEYQMWFSQLLPGLVDVDAPVPLGGTSNHFRRQVLSDIGAWDPFNVTEDADLGIRLHRRGFRTGVLDSITYEEANSDFVNWVRQRSRWYKGYLQTWLVNMRHPRELFRDLGWKAFILFNLFVGGTPLLAMLNPVFWLMTVLWFITRSTLILSLFPMPVYYAGLFSWLAGNFIFVYATMLSAFESDQPKMVMAAALTPIYWIMMAVAAAKAVVQIIVSPSYWEKTFHGLDDLAVQAEGDKEDATVDAESGEGEAGPAARDRRAGLAATGASRRVLATIRHRVSTRSDAASTTPAGEPPSMARRPSGVMLADSPPSTEEPEPGSSDAE